MSTVIHLRTETKPFERRSPRMPIDYSHLILVLD